MADIEKNLSDAGTALDPDRINNGTLDIGLPDQDVKDDARLEMHQICRGCLNITNVTEMRDTLFGGVSSISIYEEISKIKIEEENIPATMCANCTLELGKIGKFIKMLRHSYTILVKVSKEIKKLNSQGLLEVDKYYDKKMSILKQMVQEKMARSSSPDIINSFGAEPVDDNGPLSDVGLLDNTDHSHHNSGGSSDDEIPLSERFNINVNKDKEQSKAANKVKKIMVGNKKKKRRKSKENFENLPESDTVADNNKQNQWLFKERLGLQVTCPLCSKKVSLFANHLKSFHFLDWNHCTCLKCSYQNDEKDKLLMHSSECHKTEPQDNSPKYVGAEDLKINWIVDTDEGDKRENLYTDEYDRNSPKIEPIHDARDYIDAEEMKLSFDDELADENECDPDFEADEHNSYDMNELELENPKRDKPNKKKGRTKMYSCNRCDNVRFQKYEDIEEHLKTIHDGESNCVLCDQEFNNSFSLLYHMMVKHGELKCCRLCLVSFKNSNEINAHYKSEEHNTKCTVCGEQFKNRKALYEHRRKRHLNPQLENQKYKCPECPKEFANQNNIRRHVMVAHKDLRFLCDTCGQSYTTKRNLKLHIQKFHEGMQVQNKNTKKNFFCEACGRELRIFHKYAIAMHRAKHKGHNFVCKKCYDTFSTEEEFKKHVKDLGHQLYECDKCQSQFVREENFKIHLKNHDAPGWNKNMFATWGKSAKLRNEKGEFVCSYCPKVFKDKQRLDNHVRVHTNERPYKCHICSKGFKTWIHRKTHLNIHLGIKKWVCKYCSKAFTNSCTLKGHEMIHTGERPHRCPECKKGFITMSAMKKHRMVHFRTGGSGNGKKDKFISKEDVKTDSDHEENAEFIYKFGQMFTGSDVSYESFTESPNKEPPVNLVSIEKELSC